MDISSWKQKAQSYTFTAVGTTPTSFVVQQYAAVYGSTSRPIATGDMLVSMGGPYVIFNEEYRVVIVCHKDKWIRLESPGHSSPSRPYWLLVYSNAAQITVRDTPNCEELIWEEICKYLGLE